MLPPWSFQGSLRFRFAKFAMWLKDYLALYVDAVVSGNPAFFALGDMSGITVHVRINRHRGDTHAPRSFNYATCNFSTIGD